MSEELIQKWRKELDAVKDINIFDTEGELAWLAEQASKSTQILEIGCFHGASTKIMALANPEAKFLCLDAWDDDGSRETFEKNMADEIESGRLSYFQGPSFQGFDKIWELGFVPDFTFIDASHLYHDVKGDIEETLKVQGSGVIAGHDYRHNLPDDGVTRAVTEAFGDNLQFPSDSIWSHKIA
jgi:predicted O-methyltransferase YrrM